MSITRYFKLYQSANLCNPRQLPFLSSYNASALFPPTRRFLRFTRGEISRNFYVNPVPPLIAFESRIYSRSDENQRYLYFFQPHRFHRWFLSAGFAAPSNKACARNRKRKEMCGARNKD